MKFLLFTTLCLAVLPGSAWADSVIYKGGSPDQYGVYFADANYSFTMDAEPFVLAAGSSTVTGAQWWGGCSPEVTCPSADITVSVYTDVAGEPGSLVKSYSVGGANQTATGQIITNGGDPADEYVYSASFAPLTLTPGVTYFFAVGNDTGQTDTWGMESSNETGTHEQYLKGTGWITNEVSMAFNLSGPTLAALPEPSSLPVLGALAFGLLFLVHRARR